jgi:hypothetical protein
MRKKIESLQIEKVLAGKKVPILTLDAKWHELFPVNDKPANIRELENKLNQLLKKQGKLVSDIKGMKALKPKLMEEIIANMGADNTKEGRLKGKKLDRNQKLIKDIGHKMTQTEDELIELPYEIKAVNEKLIIESAKVCYQRIQMNKKTIEDTNQWILKTRNELKEKILLKQDLELKNTSVYAYMHDLLGADLLENLDIEQNLDKKNNKFR